MNRESSPGQWRESRPMVRAFAVQREGRGEQ